MAFAITADSMQPVVYDKKVELADLSATSAAQDLGKKYTKFRLTVFTKGTPAAPIYRLMLADDSGMSTGVRSVIRVANISTHVNCQVFEGVAPDGPKQFAQVVLESGTITAYDARIEAGL